MQELKRFTLAVYTLVAIVLVSFGMGLASSFQEEKIEKIETQPQTLPAF